MIVYGIDSETFNGEPCLIQIYSEEMNYKKILFVNGQTSMEQLFRVFYSLADDQSTYLFYAHNLSYDLISFFFSKRKLLADEEFNFDYQRYNVKGIYSTSFAYAVITHKHKKKTIFIIDTFAFYKGSLEKLGDIFCPDLPKLEKPSWLGTRVFKKSDVEGLKYAERDAVIVYYVGKHITSLFSDYDVRPCVSVAQLAARVFRHQFVSSDIPLQPKQVVHSSLCSYHGGKNNIVVKKGYYKDVYSIDIVSAYPFAMSLLPSFYYPSLYKGLKDKNRKKSVPPFGIYKISGHARPCKYPIVYDHGFNSVKGDFSDIWIAAPEVNEGLRSGELRIDEIYGYFYDAEKDKAPSPFKSYVDYFFKEKEHAKTEIERGKAKVLLNALYGKFIQKQATKKYEMLLYDEDKDTLHTSSNVVVAGGLFNPFIASLITSHTRAYVHRLEHKYQAIHTATDGILSLKKPKVSGSKLGDIKLEFKGDVFIFRNKLYICYSDKPFKKDDKKSKIFPKKYIVKNARHGFHGDIFTLEAMIKNGVYEYEYVKVNKLKESLKRGLSVNKFEKRTATLKGLDT